VALNNLAWEFGIVQGNLEKAMPYVEKLRAQRTQDARIWDTIGWIFARNGKTAEGEKYLGLALNLVPDYPSYLYHLGWLHAQSGDKAAAKTDLRSALDSKIPFEERKDAEAFLARLD
jgi:Flp pilus assembly protein TadD